MFVFKLVKGRIQNVQGRITKISVNMENLAYMENSTNMDNS